MKSDKHMSHCYKVTFTSHCHMQLLICIDCLIVIMPQRHKSKCVYLRFRHARPQEGRQVKHDLPKRKPELLNHTANYYKRKPGQQMTRVNKTWPKAD